LAEVSLDAVDLCSFENWFFNARKEGQAGLGPLELGLQWRVSYGKEYAGSAALKAHRESGAMERVTCAIAKQSLQPGQVVSNAGQAIGRVLRAEYSPMLEANVAMTLLHRAHAYSGIDAYTVEADGQAIPIRTVSPPVLNNRSLYVNAQKHSYATRSNHSFPPIV
jgi:glycine cleavage system aminomethyltransferase T